MAKHTEIRAAQGILERGIRAKVRAPFFLRLFRIKTINITLHRLYAGTLFQVSEYYLSTGITDEQLKELKTEDALGLMKKHGDAIFRCIACALLNNRLLIRWLTKPLASYLRANMHMQDALAMLEVVLLYNGTADFISITRYVRSLMITEPTNQGHEKAGS